MSRKVSRFAGRVAIVPGAGQGIGEAYARALAAEGAAVVVADLHCEAGAKVVAGIEADGGQAAFDCTDVASPESAQAMAALAVERFGGIDYLVNNAAIYGTMKLDVLLKVDWDYYKSFMSVNLDGALACRRACYEHMAARGGGAIVNQSSTAAWHYSSFYGLAKVGINGLTQQLAHELGYLGIRVNAIAPGPTDTAATRTLVGELASDLVKSAALQRLGQPSRPVGPCFVPPSDRASFLTRPG